MRSVNLQKANAVIDEVKKVVIGKDACIFKVMAQNFDQSLAERRAQGQLQAPALNNPVRNSFRE